MCSFFLFLETGTLCAGFCRRCWFCRKLWKLRYSRICLEPSSAPGSDCLCQNRRAEPGGCWRPSGLLQARHWSPVHKRTNRRGLKAVFLISSPTTDGVPRLSSSPITLPVWVLFYLAVLCCFIRSLSGCYEGLGWLMMQLGLSWFVSSLFLTCLTWA